jgi:hypothetical protein
MFRSFFQTGLFQFENNSLVGEVTPNICQNLKTNIDGGSNSPPGNLEVLAADCAGTTPQETEIVCTCCTNCFSD